MDAATFLAENQNNSSVVQFRPSWIMEESLLSLSSKFPLVPGSQGSVVFCTTQLSEKLQQPPVDANFDMTDPCSPPPEYHVLHDPHLKEFFRNPTMRKGLTDKGFITEDGYVKCNLLEFNEYRRWVRKLKLDAYHKKQREECENLEKLRRWRETEKQFLRDRGLCQVSKMREQHAKELMAKQRKKRQAEKRKFVKLEEEHRKGREKNEEEKRRTKDLVEATREKQLERKWKQKQKQDAKVRKIRIRFSQKRKDEEDTRESKMQERKMSVLDEKKLERKDKFKRRCSLLVDQVEQKRHQDEQQKEEHRRNVHRRTSQVQAQRRKTKALLEHCIKTRREELEKELVDAEQFLEKVRTKKQRELDEWKLQYQFVKDRQFSSIMSLTSGKVKQQRCASEPVMRLRPRLKSAWDVHGTLLKDQVIKEMEDEMGLAQSICEPVLVTENIIQAVKVREVYKEDSGEDGAGLIFLQKVQKIANGIIDSAKSLLKAEDDRDAKIHQESTSVVRQAIHAARKRWQTAGQAERPERVKRYIMGVIESSLGELSKSPSFTTLSAFMGKEAVVTATVSPGVREGQLRQAALELAEDTIVNAARSLHCLGLMTFEMDDEPEVTAITRKLAVNAISAASKSIVGLNLSGDIEDTVQKVVKGSVLATKKSLEVLRDLKAKAPYTDDKESPIILSDYLTDIPGEANMFWEEAAKTIARRALRSATASIERMETASYPEQAPKQVVTDAISAAKKALELLCNPTKEYEWELQRKLKDVVRNAVISAENSLERLHKTEMHHVSAFEAVVFEGRANDGQQEQSQSMSSDTSTPSFVSASESLNNNLNYENIGSTVIASSESITEISGTIPDVGVVITSDSNIISGVVDAMIDQGQYQSMSSESSTPSFVSASESLNDNINEATMESAAIASPESITVTSETTRDSMWSTEKQPSKSENANASKYVEETVKIVVKVTSISQEKGTKTAKNEAASTFSLKSSLRGPSPSTSQRPRNGEPKEVGDNDVFVEGRATDGPLGIEDSVNSAAGELSMRAVLSAENSIERFYKQHISAECVPSGEIELGNTVVELVNPETASAHGSSKHRENINEIEKRGEVMWLVMQYVEGIIKYAVNHVHDFELETYAIISNEEAYQAEMEYCTPNDRQDDIYLNESIELVACRVVNNVLKTSLEFILQTRTKRRFSLSDSKNRDDSEKLKGRPRKPSVKFSERSIMCTRRESYAPRESDFLSVLNRPPTPIGHRNTSPKELDIDEDADKQVANTDRASSSPENETRQDHKHEKLEKTRCSSIQTVELGWNSDAGIQQESSGTFSNSEVLASGEGNEECEISPNSSFVFLPPLNPSEHSLVAVRIVEINHEVTNKPKIPTAATGDLPVIPKKRSLVGNFDSALDASLQDNSETMQPCSSITHFPDIGSTCSTLVASSSSISTLVFQEDSKENLSSNDMGIKGSTTKSLQVSPRATEIFTKSPSQMSQQALKVAQRTSKEVVNVKPRTSETSIVRCATHTSDESIAPHTDKASVVSSQQSKDEKGSKQHVVTQLGETPSDSSMKPTGGVLSLRSSTTELPLSPTTSKKKFLRMSSTTSQKTVPRRDESCCSSRETLEASATSLAVDSKVKEVPSKGDVRSRKDVSTRLPKDSVKLTPTSSRHDALLSRKSSNDSSSRSSRHAFSSTKSSDTDVKISSRSSKGVVKAQKFVPHEHEDMSSTSFPESATITHTSEERVDSEKRIIPREQPVIVAEKAVIEGRDGEGIGKQFPASSKETIKHHLVETDNASIASTPGSFEETTLVSSLPSSQGDRIVLEVQTSEDNIKAKQAITMERTTVTPSTSGDSVKPGSAIERIGADETSSRILGREIPPSISQQSRKSVGPSSKGSGRLPPRKSKERGKLTPKSSLKVSKLEKRHSKQETEADKVPAVVKHHNLSPRASKGSVKVALSGSNKIKKGLSCSYDKSVKKTSTVAASQATTKRFTKSRSHSSEVKVEGDLKVRRSDEDSVSLKTSVPRKSFEEPEVIFWREVVEKNESVTGEKKTDKHRVFEELKDKGKEQEIHVVGAEETGIVSELDSDPAASSSGQHIQTTFADSCVSSSATLLPSSSVTKKAEPSHPGLSTVELNKNASATGSGQQLSSPMRSSTKMDAKKDIEKSPDATDSNSEEKTPSVFVSPKASALLTIAPFTHQKSFPKVSRNDSKANGVENNSQMQASVQYSKVSLSHNVQSAELHASDSNMISGVVGAAVARVQSQRVTSECSTPSFVSTSEDMKDNLSAIASSKAITVTSETMPDSVCNTDKTSRKPGCVKTSISNIISGVVGTAVSRAQSQDMSSGSSSTSSYVSASEYLNDNPSDVVSSKSITVTSETMPDTVGITKKLSAKPGGVNASKSPEETVEVVGNVTSVSPKNEAESKVSLKGSHKSLRRAAPSTSQGSSQGSRTSMTHQKTSREELKCNSSNHQRIKGILPFPPTEAEAGASGSTSKSRIAKMPSNEGVPRVTPKGSFTQTMQPSPPSGLKHNGPSPRRSRIKAIPSDESTQVRPTQSETSMSSDEQNDVAPRVSDVWIATRKEEVLRVVGARLPTQAHSTSSLPNGLQFLNRTPPMRRAVEKIAILEITPSLRTSQLKVDTPISADLKPDFQVQGTSIVKSS